MNSQDEGNNATYTSTLPPVSQEAMQNNGIGEKI